MENRKRERIQVVLSKALTYKNLTQAQLDEGEIPMDHWFFEGNSFFVRVDFIYDLVKPNLSRAKFTIDLKKNFPKCITRRLQNNVNYIKCSFNTDGNLVIENK